ncbi:flavodoxin family protein [Candidatus Bipolaricaulota bacterium]|nr:flavodoxin family protein [Candidatus Bipolaricaulota bacterium]
MKTLIVSYSLTGHTQQLVDEVAALLNADVEVLQSSIKRGFFGYVRLAFDMLRKKEPILGPVVHVPGEYDMVVLAGPIWSSRMCSPTRIYAMQHKEHFTKTALLCTSRSGEPGYAKRCADSMTKAIGINPVAMLGLSMKNLKADHSQAIAQFVTALNADGPQA